MIVLFSIIFFILGFVLREIFTYIYNINKKIKQADEILEKERERLQFKKKHDFSDSFKDNENQNHKL